MKTSFVRNPIRELPDGQICKTFPFHISLEGLKNRVLCKDDEDYDAFVKIICVCVKRKNSILLIYAVVSNHAHLIILASSQSQADGCAEEIKRMYSMYFRRKYNDPSVMKGVDAKSIFIDSDFYLRNAIAYDIRNAMDNGANSIQSYKWSGYRGIFAREKRPAGTEVRLMTKRDRRRIMHTDDNLSGVSWIVDGDESLEPVTICNWTYVESAFLQDQGFFMKTIGVVNQAELMQKLVLGPRVKSNDQELLRLSEDISKRWFNTNVHDIPLEKKAKVAHYLYHTRKTDFAQLARVLEVDRDYLKRILL